MTDISDLRFKKRRFKSFAILPYHNQKSDSNKVSK
jgi:hypothetical protein